MDAAYTEHEPRTYVSCNLGWAVSEIFTHSAQPADVTTEEIITKRGHVLFHYCEPVSMCLVYIEVSENKLITIAGKYTGNLKPYLICSTSPFYKATPSETKKLTL